MDRKHVRGLLSFLGFLTFFQGVLSLKMPGYLAQGAGGGLAQSTFVPVKERGNLALLTAGRGSAAKADATGPEKGCSRD